MSKNSKLPKERKDKLKDFADRKGFGRLKALANKPDVTVGEILDEVKSYKR